MMLACYPSHHSPCSLAGSHQSLIQKQQVQVGCGDLGWVLALGWSGCYGGGDGIMGSEDCLLIHVLVMGPLDFIVVVECLTLTPA